MSIQLNLVTFLLKVLLLTLIPLLGCSFMDSSTAVEQKAAAVLRPHNQQAKVMEIAVDREVFIAALANVDNMNRIRLIEVVASDEGGRSEFPEYRLFSILPKSAYAALGFEEGDVLVAVNDYALNYSDRFRSYVQVLHIEPGEVFAEIRRNGQPLILKWKFS